MNGGTCYFDYEKIEISESLSVTLNMEEIDKNSLEAKFQELLPPLEITEKESMESPRT